MGESVLRFLKCVCVLFRCGSRTCSVHASHAPLFPRAPVFSPSFLPPAPTISSSHSRINCEPEVTAAGEEVSGEESNEEDGDEGDEVDEGDEGDEVDEGSDGKDIWFGPPRGRQQAKSGSTHEEPLAKGTILFYVSIFYLLIIIYS